MQDYLEKRIKYLKDQEKIALVEIDGLPTPSIQRTAKWELIKALTERRRELEDALKFYNSNPAGNGTQPIQDLEVKINLLIRKNENEIMDELACEETTEEIMKLLATGKLPEDLNKN